MRLQQRISAGTGPRAAAPGQALLPGSARARVPERGGAVDGRGLPVLAVALEDDRGGESLLLGGAIVGLVPARRRRRRPELGPPAAQAREGGVRRRGFGRGGSLAPRRFGRGGGAEVPHFAEACACRGRCRVVIVLLHDGWPLIVISFWFAEC